MVKRDRCVAGESATPPVVLGIQNRSTLPSTRDTVGSRTAASIGEGGATSLRPREIMSLLAKRMEMAERLDPSRNHSALGSPMALLLRAMARHWGVARSFLSRYHRFTAIELKALG